MTETLPNEQAFPIPASHTVQYGSTRTVHGMTKREYFAAMAMQNMTRIYRIESADVLAKAAVAYADALIEALNNKSANKKADDPDKERIMRAYISGLKSDMLNPVSDSLYMHLAEQYYNETYGKQ